MIELILQQELLLLQLLIGIELYIAAVSFRPAILLFDRLDAWAHTGQLVVREVGHGLDLLLCTISALLTHVLLMYEVIEEALGLRLLYLDHFLHLALTSPLKVENISPCCFGIVGLRRAWISIAIATLIQLEIWQHGAHISLLFLISTRIELCFATGSTSILRTMRRLSDAVHPGRRRLIKRYSVHIHTHN